MNKEEEFATSNFGNDKFLDQSGISSPNNLDNNMNQHEESVNRGIKFFTYDELKLATREFGSDTFFGGGHYTKAYKGWVDRTTYSPCKENTGLPIAVIVRHDYINFDSLKVWKAFCHPNLVKLTGLCFKCENPILVYEFMLKGNFEDLIHSGSSLNQSRHNSNIVLLE
ncbi:hypothetical protein L1987_01496 [Smallanthus sonchifolius]|uniref:Uncharacterized protein n=1 Tax=Smallanthus sonchifolius TaxID=185202 RepID=A0ACB9K571_9ASTR|nr:hypothetical protein L1987_01496 [Smallanthus sonchifolius]